MVGHNSGCYNVAVKRRLGELHWPHAVDGQGHGQVVRLWIGYSDEEDDCQGHMLPLSPRR
jgi:hypothetical protein